MKISTLSSPAEQTLLGAIENSGCHLNALVRFDAIELLLIARAVINQSLVEPSAPFHG